MKKGNRVNRNGKSPQRIVRMTFRVPRELAQQIDEIAQEVQRSRNWEMVALLREAVAWRESGITLESLKALRSVSNG